MEARTHYCPNCGGPLTFEPKDQKFHCPFCLSVFTPEELFALEKEKEAQEEQKAKEKTEEISTDTTTQEQDVPLDETETDHSLELFLCPSCGAEIVSDSTTAATYCYFCHNPVILQERLSGKFKPEKVIPFTISKEEAIEKFTAWIRKKHFVPKNFYNEEQIKKITGVYFPYWSVDAKTQSYFKGTGTKIRMWTIGDTEYTETKEYKVIRNGEISFNSLIKPALNKNLRENMITSIQPFDLNEGVPFKDAYLAGFQGEKRDIEFEELKESYQEDLKDYSQNVLLNHATEYTTVIPDETRTSILEEENHYLLLPLWILTYHDEKTGKVFYYAMNGQNGNTAGRLPVDNLKLGLVTGASFLAAFILVLLVGYFT